MGTEVAVASLLLTAYATKEQIEEKKEAKVERQRASEAQQRMAAIEGRRERMRAIREARIKRAQVVAAAEAAGTSGSSGEVGALSSLSTQLSSEIGAFQIREGMSIFAQQRLDAAARHEERASIFGAVGGLSSQAFLASGGFKELFKTEKIGD